MERFDFEKTVAYLKTKNPDYTERSITFHNEILRNGRIELFYISQLTDRAALTESVVKPLVLHCSSARKAINAQIVIDSIIYADNCRIESDSGKIEDFILLGMVVILFSNDKQYIVVNLKKVEHRSVPTPQLSYTIRGPQDCFAENLDANLSLIRYRVKDKNMRIKYFEVGRRTKARVAVIYIEDIANDTVVNEIQKRIERIDVDGIGESGELQSFLLNNKLQLFPQIGLIERSDMAYYLLLKGKVMVLVDGSGIALLAPKIFSEFFYSCDDRYDNSFFGLFARLLRYAAIIIALTGSSLFVALTSFHTDVLPVKYAISLSEMRSNVPFTALIGASLLEFIMELLREALLRVPKQIGSAIGIVGAIVIGSAAVSAGIFSPLLLIIVSTSLLASFAIPDYSLVNPFRLLKFILLLFTGTMGFFGFTVFLTFILAKLVSLDSFSSNNNSNNNNSSNNNNNNTITNNNNTISNDGDGDEEGEDSAFKIEANVDKVAMDQKKNKETGEKEIGLRGISVNTTVGFPKDYFPPPVDIGAEAGLRVDTFKDPAEIGFDVDIDLKVIEVQGELEFVLYQNKYPIPDTLGLYVGSEVGVKIIPPIPVATLNGVGGKIENLYSLVDWDRMYSAPLTVSITATATICEILKMDHVTMSINWQQVQIKGNIGIKDYDIIKDATIRLRWYNPFSFELSARLEAFQCIEGGVMLRIAKDEFLGLAYARLFIPEDVALIGGLELLSAELGVSHEMIWGEIKIIGIGAGIKYVYGESFPEFYSAVADSSAAYPEGLLTVGYTDEATGQKAVIVYGTNLRLVGSSSGHVYALRETGALAAAGNNPFLPQGRPRVYALDSNRYELNVSGGEAVLFEMEYEGTKPMVKVYRPDGSEYPLLEDLSGNLRFQTIPADSSKSGKTEQKIWISVINPEPGAWKAVSDKPLASASLYDVRMPPEMTSINGAKQNPHQVKVDWAGEYLSGARINLVLVEAGSTAAGRLLTENIDAAAGTCTVTIPDDVPTGDYDIRAEISKEDYGYITKTVGPFAIIDLKAPAAPEALKVEPAGNGMFRVSWTEGRGNGFEPEGYMLNVLHEDGSAVEGFPEAYVQGVNEAILGGEARLQDGTVIRLEPGNPYKISVAAHYEEKAGEGEAIGKQHFSLPVISEAVLLPVPHPPELRVLVKQGEKTVPLNTSEESADEFLATGADITLTLKAGDIIDADVLVNDETTYSRSGSNAYDIEIRLREGENKITVKAFNAVGDRTVKMITVKVDSKPPLLLIETAAIRTEGGKTYADIRGKSEQGCVLTVNGDLAYMDGNGRFEHTLLIGDAMTLNIRMTAEDSSGNKTEYESTLYNDTLQAIQEVEISLQNGGSVVQAK